MVAGSGDSGSADSAGAVAGWRLAVQVISAQKVLFGTLFKIGFECFLRTNHIN